MQTEIEYNDIELWVEYDYEEGEEQTYDYIGSAPEVYLYSIFVRGVDIYNLFDANQLEEIKEILIKHNE